LNAARPPDPWLQTKRLRLREFSTADQYALVNMHKDPRVRALLVDDYPLDRHVVTHELITKLQKFYREHEGLGIWCAEYNRPHRVVTTLNTTVADQHRTDDALSLSSLEKQIQPKPRFAGWFNLMPMTEQPEEVELGSRLLPEVWGIGLALEGGELLLKHAFNTLGRDRVWAVGHIEHRSVRYCVTALGFKSRSVREYEGTTAQYYRVDQEEWRAWQKIPRRDRQRHAVAVCKVEPS